MNYRVVYTDQFHDALEAQIKYFREEKAPASRIAAWLENVLDLVDSLDAFPLQHPVSADESALRGIELRKIIFGNYLGFYHVDEESKEVYLLGFRHGSRLP